MSGTLAGRVCIVTGATRGIGKGIALQLGEAGATVYITGRTLKPKPNDAVGGSLEETAEEVTKRGGTCIPVQCDHGKEDEIKALFDRVEREQNGRLDILVNNAYSAVTAIMGNLKKKFWETEPSMWDTVNNVGLRNHYYCAVYASRMMVARGNGLIINISSPGGLRYLFNVAYGVGKEACDRMAVDCAFELRKQNVAFISLWPGAVRTEQIQNKMDDINKSTEPVDKDDQQVLNIFEHGETPEFAGRCIVHLATDKDLMAKSGHIIMTGDLADEYGIDDVNGNPMTSTRRVKGLLNMFGWKKTAMFTPSFIKLPYWVMALGGNKF